MRIISCPNCGEAEDVFPLVQIDKTTMEMMCEACGLTFNVTVVVAQPEEE